MSSFVMSVSCCDGITTVLALSEGLEKKTGKPMGYTDAQSGPITYFSIELSKSKTGR